MKILAIIPARGGSKGVPGKNLKSFAGKPLIAWSIGQALDCPRVDRVLVSTDCNEIAAVARQWGAEVPFLRPDELAQDTSPTEPALIHAIEELAKTGYHPDAVMLLQPTSPYRRDGRLAEAVEKFVVEDADSLVSGNASHPFYWQNPANPKATYDYNNRPRRQDIPEDEEFYKENGSIYITRTEMLLKNSNRLGGKIALFPMTEVESYDIDTRADFFIAEQLMRQDISGDDGACLTKDDVDAVLFDFDGVLTDNRVLTLQDGTEAVTCNRSDGMAFNLFREMGMPTFIVSTEINPVVAARSKKINVPVMHGVADKAEAVAKICADNGFDPAKLIFVGNDINDLPALRAVGYPIAVADAHPAVKAAAWRVLECRGGETVAREVIDTVFNES